MVLRNRRARHRKESREGPSTLYEANYLYCNHRRSSKLVGWSLVAHMLLIWALATASTNTTSTKQHVELQRKQRSRCKTISLFILFCVIFAGAGYFLQQALQERDRALYPPLGIRYEDLFLWWPTTQSPWEVASNLCKRLNCFGTRYDIGSGHMMHLRCVGRGSPAVIFEAGNISERDDSLSLSLSLLCVMIVGFLSALRGEQACHMIRWALSLF